MTDGRMVEAPGRGDDHAQGQIRSAAPEEFETSYDIPDEASLRRDRANCTDTRVSTVAIGQVQGSGTLAASRSNGGRYRRWCRVPQKIGRPSPVAAWSATVLAIAFILAAAVPAIAVTTITSLPFEADVAGETYVINSDLSSASSGILITADNVTIEGNGHHLSGVNGDIFYIERAHGCTIRNLTFDWSGASSTLRIDTGNNNVVQNISGVGGQLEVWRCEGNQILDSNFDGPVGSGANFTIGFNDWSAADNITLRNNTFHMENDDTDNMAWFVYATNCLVENNTFILDGADDHEILQMQWSHYNVVRKNKFFINGYGRVSIRSQSSFNLFEENEIYSETGQGFWQVGGGTNNTYRRNIVFSQDQAFRTSEGSADILCEENLFVAPGTTIYIDDATGDEITFHNNTMINMQTTEASRVLRISLPASQDVYFRNNIMYTRGSRIMFCQYDVWDGLNMDYNLYFIDGPLADYMFRYQGDSYSSLSSFQSGTGLEAHGLQANPMLANIDGTPEGDYELTAGSPAIDAGDPSFPVPEGGGSRIDIGYREFGSTGGSSDTTPPATVSNLATGTISTSSVSVSWTAVGDDGFTGQASSYDLRYSTGPIDASNWASASQVVGEPLPKVSGQSESFNVTGLDPGTTYYFALKVADEAANWSGISNVVSAETEVDTGGDTTPPSAPLNFGFSSSTSSSVSLSWRAPGDDGLVGQASAYELRLSSSPIDDGNFLNATLVPGLPAPGGSGALESFTVTGLVPSTTYYFAMRAADEELNWSGLSTASGVTEADEGGGDDSLEGWGSGTSGGSGGSSYVVTSLADSGPGSLRDAVSQPNRDISFSVAGTILLNSPLYVTGHHLTIDGSTAPNAGITITAASPSFSGPLFTLDDSQGTPHDVIIRGLRFRDNPDDDAGDNMRLVGPGVYNVVVDHCSFRRAGDGNIDITDGAHDITVQWSILAVADENSLLRAVSNISLHHNLYVHGMLKNPRVRTNSYPVDVVNNVVFNWGSQWGTQFFGNGGGNLVNNYFKAGAQSNRAAAFLVDASATATYAAGNVVPPETTSSGNTGTRIPAPPISETSASTAFSEVLADVGAFPRDVDDAQYVFDALIGGGADTQAPSAVDDLNVVSTSLNSATLNWTAVGDNGGTGTAATYDLRYSTAPVTSATWNSAQQASGEPAPSLAGTSQSFTVNGLAANTTYFFALKVADEVPNWSGLSNLTSGATDEPPPGGDETAPAPVTDVSVVAVGNTTITLQWTATGDDGSSGNASAYDIRYSTSSINSSSWNTATQVQGEISPGAPGSNQVFTIGGLPSGTTQYFAMKVGDEVPNWSTLSNVTSGTTNEVNGVDDTPPGTVDDLEAVELEPTRIRMKWSATGDDGFSGNADHYELRFSDSLITEVNWDSSTTVLGLPNPGSPGSPQYAWIDDLAPLTTYFIGIRVYDDVDNASAVSNIIEVETPSDIDITPPDVVDDLSGESDGPTAVKLNWTAPGDEGNPVAVYEIRVQSSPIPDIQDAPLPGEDDPLARAGGGDSFVFEVALSQVEGGPLDPGMPEEYVVGNLDPATLYFSRVRSRDHAGNWSQLSNQVEVTTDEEEIDPPDDPDTAAPAPIADMSVSDFGSDFAVLVWTATGDDGPEGTADSIDVRLGTALINELNWPFATSLPGLSAPLAAGQPETLRVEGLEPGEAYFFAARAFDEAGNASSLSNSASVTTEFLPDTAAPHRVADLAATDSTETTITLQFTAPADSVSDGAEGPGDVATYELRSVALGETLDEDTWAAADSLPAPSVGTPGETVTWAITGLTASTGYTFALRSTDAAGNQSALSNLVDAQTGDIVPDPDTTPPAPISDVEFIATDPWTGALSWTAVGDDSLDAQASVYDIRSLVGTVATPPDPDATGAWDDAEVLDHGLTPAPSGTAENLVIEDLVGESIYTFGIRAIDDEGNLGEVRWSELVEMPSDDDNLAPNEITDLDATAVDSTSVFLQWTAPTDPQPYLDVQAVSRYVVRWTATPLNDDNWESFSGEATLDDAQTPGSGESLQLLDLTPGATYFFGVRSFDSAGNQSPLSNVVFVEMPQDTTDIDPNDPNDPNEPEPDTTPPASVNSLVGYATGIDGIRLTWVSVGDDGSEGTAARYEFRYSSDEINEGNWNGATEIESVPPPSPPGELESFDWTGLTPATTYHVALKVFDEEGNESGLSNPISVTTPEFQDAAPPAVPSLIWAEYIDGDVIIHWNPSGDLDLAGYQVHRRTEGKPGLLIMSEHWTNTSFVDETAVEGDTYAYSVAARDISGNLSGRSTEVLITVPEEATLSFQVEEQGADPVEPTRDRVLLYWEISRAADVDGFHVYRERVGGVDHTPSPSDPVGPRQRITSSLIQGSDRFFFEQNPLPDPGYYRYWVEAWGADGSSRFLEDPIPVVVPEWEEAVIGVFPNPMFEQMTVAFSLPEREDVQVSIYSAEGRLLYKEVEAGVSSGRHEWSWDGLTTAGERVATGTYFVVFRAGRTNLREKVVVLR